MQAPDPSRRLIALLMSLASPALADPRVIETFEGDGFGDWKVEGTAFGLAPVPGEMPGLNGRITGFSGGSLAVSSNRGDSTTGTLTSPEFPLDARHVAFLVVGGDHPGRTAAQLLIDGEVVREALGRRDLVARPVVWDVEEFSGKMATFRLIDTEQGEWGWIGADHLMLTNDPEPEFPPTRTTGGRTGGNLVATDVIAGATIPDGSRMILSATHADQGVTSPTAFAFDDEGRVYLAETHRFRHGVEDNRDNLFWYLDDLAAQKTEDRLALHEKWNEEVSLEFLQEKSEYIRVLEDSTGDGVLDRSSIYADDFNDVLDGTAAGIFYYQGTIFFANIPKLWMLRDTNGDGVADNREVLADGFGVKISLSGHDLNGFALGPDGRIYGTIGDRGFSVVTREGREYHYPNEGAVFRFEPDGSDFELVHTGLRNPKEIAFDALGNAFSVDNNADMGDGARIVYIVEGADSGWQMEHQTMFTFHRQIGLVNRPPNRWMDERTWELENDVQPAYVLPPSALLTSGPSGLTVHPGTGFLENERGRFLICDYRGGAANSGIWSFEMEPTGAGMRMSDSRRFLWGVAATDVEYSWDGRVMVSDFVTGWRSHEDGRMLTLDAEENLHLPEESAEVARLVREGFDQRESEELATLLFHPDARVRIRAQIALTWKEDALDRFSAAADSDELLERVHGAWGLGILARRGGPVPTAPSVARELPPVDEDLQAAATAKLVELLDHEDAETRAQALRALADAAVDGDELPLAARLRDESPRVRFFAATAVARRTAAEQFVNIVAMLAANANEDRYLSHAGAYALERLAADEPSALVGLMRHDSAAVRLAAVVALRRLQDPALTAFVGDSDQKVVDEAVIAVTDLSLDEGRAAVAQLLDRVGNRDWSPFMLRRLIHNSFRLGTTENFGRLLSVAMNGDLPQEIREEALRLVSLWSEPPPVDQLTGHWRPLEERDVEPIRPLLEEAVPQMVRRGGFLLTAALGLVERYDIDLESLDDASLRALVANEDLPDEARAKGVELLIEREPNGLDDLLVAYAASPSDALATAALAGLVARAPERAVEALRETVASDDSPRAHAAWNLLAAVPGEEAAGLIVDGLARLESLRGISPQALEIIAAAEAREESEVVGALDSLRASLAEDEDPLAKWLPALQGGDPESGRALFQSHPTGQCMRCHRIEDGHGGGEEAGPQLAGVANRHDARYFLESLIFPSAEITPGFGLVAVNLVNGASLGGNLIAETDDTIDLDVGGKLWRIRRDDIAALTPPVSSMPPMDALLTKGEMRDLVAYLGTLTEGGEPLPDAAEPELLDPASLVTPPPAPGVGDVAEEAAPVEAGAAEATEEDAAVEDAATEEAPSVEADAAAAAAATGVDPAIMTAGQASYLVCAACHGQNGEGGPAGPPLAGSEWVTGPAENLIRIQLRGLQGPISVKGVEYDMVMPPMAYQTDDQIAAVLTYIRNSFGNEAPLVTPDEVAAFRDEVNQPMLTVADLIPPVVPALEAGFVSRYADLQPNDRIPLWVFLMIAIVVGALVAPVANALRSRAA